LLQLFATLAGARKAVYELRVAPKAPKAHESTSTGNATANLEANDAAPMPTPVRPPGWDGGSVELLGVSGQTALFQCSSLRSPPSVWARRQTAKGYDWTLVVDTFAQLKEAGYWPDVATSGGSTGAGNEGTSGSGSAPVQPRMGSGKLWTLADEALSELRRARLERVRLSAEEGGAEALVIIPSAATRASTDEATGGRCPWVLRPHGGPHAACMDLFNVEISLLLASGVAVILPNYRGSLGYGAAFAQALIGHVGEMDVTDCAALTRAALQQFSAELDPDRGAVYGGSHGGFLTAWLLGSAAHSELYACGVLWNPVVDLAGCSLARPLRPPPCPLRPRHAHSASHV
jgi:dipeptidyl aminopeptidase/acylaminoacyl peptidase